MMENVKGIKYVQLNLELYLHDNLKNTKLFGIRVLFTIRNQAYPGKSPNA